MVLISAMKIVPLDSIVEHGTCNSEESTIFNLAEFRRAWIFIRNINIVLLLWTTSLQRQKCARHSRKIVSGERLPLVATLSCFDSVH